jgi:hypothetical protein
MRTKAMNDLCADEATKLYYSNGTRFIPRGSATPVGDFTETSKPSGFSLKKKPPASISKWQHMNRK